MDISKSFLQDPTVSVGVTPKVNLLYIRSQSDSTTARNRVVYHQLTAHLDYGDDRIAEFGPSYIEQAVGVGQQTHDDLSFQVSRWVLDRIKAPRVGTGQERSTLTLHSQLLTR